MQLVFVKTVPLEQNNCASHNYRTALDIGYARGVNTRPAGSPKAIAKAIIMMRKKSMQREYLLRELLNQVLNRHKIRSLLQVGSFGGMIASANGLQGLSKKKGCTKAAQFCAKQRL